MTENHTHFFREVYDRQGVAGPKASVCLLRALVWSFSVGVATTDRLKVPKMPIWPPDTQVPQTLGP